MRSPRKAASLMAADRIVIQIRIPTLAEKAQYQRAADTSGLSLSAWMRQVLMRAARKGA